jgi:hypothetical protein
MTPVSKTMVVDERDDHGGLIMSTVMLCYSCDGCQHYSVAYGYSYSRDPDDPHDPNVGDIWFKRNLRWVRWWPPKKRHVDLSDVPRDLADTAREAYLCLSVGALRAALPLARAVIEATAKTKGITDGLVYQKIDKMAQQDYIRPHIKEAAHEVRHFGNVVAHGDLHDKPTEEDVALALELMFEVLEEVFQSPARVQRAVEARKNRQAAAEELEEL